MAEPPPGWAAGAWASAGGSSGSGGASRREASHAKGSPVLWSFIHQEAVEPTNNAAERALRKPVLWRKNSFGSGSGRGMRFVERILTVSETCRQHQQSVLDYLTRALLAQRNGLPAPALLSAH